MPAAMLSRSVGFDAGSTDDGGDEAFAQAERDAALLEWLVNNAAAAEKHVDRYCEETKSLQGKRALAEPSRSRDAAFYLAGRADWEDAPPGLLHLPASITERMANPPMAWRRAGPDLYAGLDFTWMMELLQFDHWSLLAAGSLRDKEDVGLFEAPLPNYLTLQSWVKLRLLKGVHENDLARASVEVRHLADLCGSSGTLVGEMIRLAIYGIERKTWEDVGQPMPEGGLSQDEVSRARHASMAGFQFLYPGVPAAVREKALKCSPLRCATLMEGIGITASLSRLAPTAIRDLAWLLEQSSCDPTLARRLARSPPANAQMLNQLVSFPSSLLQSMRELTDGGL